MATGMPIAFAFLLVNVVGVILLWNGEAGLRQLALSMVVSVKSFVFLPVPLFILMGELLFRSGVAPRMITALDQISVGRILIGGIIPGLLMAILYAAYIIIRCRLQPSIAPSYEVAPIPLSEKLVAIGRDVLPLGFIVFALLGVIFLGIATPSEAAATGALASFILAAFTRGLNWNMLKQSFLSTLQLTAMIMIIIAAAKAFSQVLAFSGTTQGLFQLVSGLPVGPSVVVMLMLATLLLMGMFLSLMAMIMISVPIMFPVINVLGLDPLWFGLMMLLTIEMSQTSPPFVTLLFIMKGAAPPDTTMGDIYRAGLPFLGCDLIVLSLMVALPEMVLWLPKLML